MSDDAGGDGGAAGTRSEPSRSAESTSREGGLTVPTGALEGVLELPEPPLSRPDLPWLAAVLAVGLAIAVTYVATNEFPAYGAGLYTVIADAIRAAGYGLPRNVSGYSTHPIPVAYPPLAFYGLAVLRDLGVGMYAAARFVPPLVTALALVPAYLLGRDLLGTRARGCVAAVLVGVNPQVLQWHISAGGLVRAPAFLFALTSAYAAYRLFHGRDVAWLLPATVAFTLTTLTHPTYTLFVVLSAVLFWVGYDRSLAGLLRGTVMGFGGVVLSSPWWVTVIRLHGPSVFSAAAGTHGGIGGGLADGVSVWTLTPVVAALVLALAGWRVLPAWVVLCEATFAQPRFTFTVGAIALVAAAVVVGRRLPAVVPDRPGARRTVAVAVVVCAAVVGVGVLAVTSLSETDETTPAFVDEDDVAAMEWAESETPPDATFVVLGDTAEWFPAATGRTILVSPWGAEWRSPEAYHDHVNAFVNASTCQSAGCLDRSLAIVGAQPDYVYVPRGGYTVRGFRHVQFGTLERSLEHTGRYEQVYANEGVVIYRVHPGGANASASVDAPTAANSTDSTDTTDSTGS